MSASKPASLRYSSITPNSYTRQGSVSSFLGCPSMNPVARSAPVSVASPVISASMSVFT